MLPLVSIIICTRNRKEILEKYALNSIFNLDYSNFEVIIVDDASTDETERFLQKFQKCVSNLKIIRNNQHRGLGYARNLGAKHAKGEIIAFTDDDCTIDKNWLNELIKPFFDKNIMAIGGLSYVKDTNELFGLPGLIFGCNMAFRASLFKVFEFDPNFRFAHEETDLVYRIKIHNYKTSYSEKATVKHYEVGALYRNSINRRLDHYYMRAKSTPILKYYLEIPRKMVGTSIMLLKEYTKMKISFVGMLIKTIFVCWALLFVIPFKAKMRHRQEEKMLKNI